MKIKTKKEMNLPQLIEWGFKNNIRNESYITIDEEGYELYFDLSGTPRYSNFITKYDTFTVTIEEDITEDTVIPKLIEIGIGNLLGYSAVNENISINEIANKKSLVLYVLNDDYSMTPIWKKGKLVE